MGLSECDPIKGHPPVRAYMFMSPTSPPPTETTKTHSPEYFIADSTPVTWLNLSRHFLESQVGHGGFNGSPS